MKNASVKEKDFDNNLLQTAATIDGFEGYANSHAARIAVLSESVAQKFNLSSADCSALRRAALVHDLGELTMNRDYIAANRSLSDEERADMLRHPVIGEQDAAKRGLSRAAQLIIRWHHEWWNGSGYPDALEREQIPLVARILRVADTYCALTGARPFRGALPDNEARRYLTEWAGIEFDPQVVKMFLELKDLPELKSFAGAAQSQLAR